MREKKVGLMLIITLFITLFFTFLASAQTIPTIEILRAYLHPKGSEMPGEPASPPEDQLRVMLTVDGLEMTVFGLPAKNLSGYDWTKDSLKAHIETNFDLNLLKQDAQAYAKESKVKVRYDLCDYEIEDKTIKAMAMTMLKYINDLRTSMGLTPRTLDEVNAKVHQKLSQIDK